MDSTYQVKITQLAQEQMREIVHYIVSELKAPDAALHLLDQLEEAIFSLAHHPYRVALTDEEPWRSHGIHRMPVKHYLVYFWIDEDAKKVQVTAVIYQKRDQASQLAQMEME